MSLTQKQRFWLSHRAIADTNAHVMEMIHHPVNPLTNNDLRKLVERYPERWGRFAGLIGKLPEGRKP